MVKHTRREITVPEILKPGLTYVCISESLHANRNGEELEKLWM